MVNPWETVRGINTMEAIQTMARRVSSIEKELAKANDLKMVELGLMSAPDFKKKYSMEEEK